MRTDESRNTGYRILMTRAVRELDLLNYARFRIQNVMMWQRKDATPSSSVLYSTMTSSPERSHQLN
jgi:hypothetical protein